MLTHKGTQAIETPRLLLRKAVISDAVPMFRNWASDPEVTKYLTWPAHEHTESTRKILELWISQYETPCFYQWMIVEKDVGEPIGSISVVRQDEDAAEMEVGYCIGRQWWHQGIMTEALTAVIVFLFRDVAANRICAKHDTNNPHSGDVMKKCGMKQEGIIRTGAHNNQGVCDTAQYAICRTDWEKDA